MKKIILFVGFLVVAGAGLFMWKTTPANAAYGIYYGTDAVVAQSTYRFNPIIIQPYNVNLYKGYTGKKICYLSVSEFGGDAAALQSLGLASSTIGFNSVWNSYRMNVADPKWQSYLLSEEKNRKSLGCAGLFLDTIWDDTQKSAIVAMIGKLRANWKTGFFVANNAHTMKADIVKNINAFMFENFFAAGSTANDLAWYAAQVAEYKTFATTYKKKLYAISYGDPFADTVWGEEVRKQAVASGFETMFLDRNVTQIYGYVNLVTGTLQK